MRAQFSKTGKMQKAERFEMISSIKNSNRNLMCASGRVYFTNFEGQSPPEACLKLVY